MLNIMMEGENKVPTWSAIVIVLSYQGQKGDFIIKSMKKRLKTLLPGNVI